jgi:GTP-binding protein Era
VVGEHRFGFVVCLGRTNVGKSTLINRLLGQKLAIVSRKPQTTRRRVRGILNLEKAQVVFVDTPGLHDVNRPVNRSLERQARQGVEGADLVLVVTDPLASKQAEVEERVLDIVRQGSLPSLLVINKVDLMSRESRAEMVRQSREKGLFDQIWAVSSKTGENLGEMISSMEGMLPAGPPLYPDDILSDQPEREFFAEIIREKVFDQVHQELPYAVAVVVEEVEEERMSGLTRVRAVIHVERDSQKGILIGGGGLTLRRIGSAARMDMEKLTGAKIFLSLWVKVRKNWTRDPKALREFGFD